jgi:hypothetical protein
MKRERATTILNEMLDRLEENTWPLNLVTEIHLFGSYTRGAVEVGDIDVAVQHTSDEHWTEQSLNAFIDGRDGYTPMRRALRGNRRGVSFQFQGRDSLQGEGFELFLLWRRGEATALARQRLAAIMPDPVAGRAPRDHVLHAYEQLADLIPRPVRIDLHRWSTDGKATVTAFALPDGHPRSTAATRHMEQRWGPSSPLRRAAAAALAHLESTGQVLERCEVHRQYLAHGATDATIDCFVDLGWRYWRSAGRYLADGQSWFEVLPATPRQPLNALHIAPAAQP